jgi:hypothetical protein
VFSIECVLYMEYTHTHNGSTRVCVACAHARTARRVRPVCVERDLVRGCVLGETEYKGKRDLLCVERDLVRGCVLGLFRPYARPYARYADHTRERYGERDQYVYL